MTKLVQLGVSGTVFLVVLYVLDMVVRSIRWQALLRAQEVFLPVRSLFLPIISSLAVNLFTIARAGETVRLYTLKKQHNTRYADTLASILIEQVVSTIGLIFVVIGSLILLGNSLQQTDHSKILKSLILILILCGIGGVTVLGLIFWKPRLGEQIILVLPSFIQKRILSGYHAFIQGLLALRTKPTLLITGIGTSIGIWLIEGFMVYIIASAVFSHFPLVEIPWAIAASTIGNITFILPILPGAMGEYEVIVALILINAPSYPGTFATLVAVIDRIFKTIFLGFLGGYATLLLGGREILRLTQDPTSKVINNPQAKVAKNEL